MVMASRVRNCCVPLCTDRSSLRHYIPSDPKIRSLWVQRINNPKFEYLDSSYLRNYVVCDLHFDKMCKIDGKLIKCSLPTLKLPDYHDGSTKENCFYSPSPNGLEQRIPKLARFVESLMVVSGPSKLGIGNAELRVRSTKRKYKVKKHGTQLSYALAKIKNSLLADVSIDLPKTQESTHQLIVDFTKDVSCSYEVLTGKSTYETSKFSANRQESTDTETFTFLTEIPSIIEADDGGEPDFIHNLFDILEDKTESEILETSPHSLEIPEDEAPIFEKPYFTTVKSYLKDQNCFADVCRICFRSVVEEDVVLRLNNSSTTDEFRTKLKVILPDLDLDIYQNSAFCRNCTQVVENSYELRQKWLLTEEKLQKIIDKKKNDRNSNSDLVIMMKSTVDDEIIDIDENTNMANSTKNVWGSGPYICDSCADVFTELRLFKIHLAKHKQQNETDQNQQTICEICGEFFTSGVQYKEHFIKHAKLRNECRVCKKSFKNRRRLNIHIKHNHIKSIHPFKRNADKNVLHGNLMNIRRKKLNSGRYYLCHLCNKQFLFTWYLEQHLRVHYDKFECEHCGKFIKFGNSSKVSQNSRTICL